MTSILSTDMLLILLVCQGIARSLRNTVLPSQTLSSKNLLSTVTTSTLTCAPTQSLSSEMLYVFSLRLRGRSGAE
jgi:hypothetical protein